MAPGEVVGLAVAFGELYCMCVVLYGIGHGVGRCGIGYGVGRCGIGYCVGRCGIGDGVGRCGIGYVFRWSGTGGFGIVEVGFLGVGVVASNVLGVGVGSCVVAGLAFASCAFARSGRSCPSLESLSGLIAEALQFPCPCLRTKK